MRIVRAIAVSTALLTGGLVIPASPAHAQELSDGCSLLHLIGATPQESDLIFLPEGTFSGGETIIGMASAPTTPGSTAPSQVELDVGGEVVDSQAFVAGGTTLQYSIPGTGPQILNVVFRTVPTGTLATWTFDCVADPVALLTTLQDILAGIDATNVGGLEAKVAAALAALGIDDTAGACGSLGAFQNMVSAQTGKALTTVQASELGGLATEIQDLLGC